MMKSLKFSYKMQLTDKGELVLFGRVLVPEYNGKVKVQTNSEESMDMSTHIIEVDDDTKVTCIVFTHLQEQFIDPKDGKMMPNSFIRNFQCRLVGPYLCYRQYTDDKIRVRRIINENDPIDPNQKERCISFKSILTDPEDKKFMTFSRVPATSFQTMKSETEVYGNLLEVVVRNMTYLFDLDTEDLKEVNFVESIDQLADPDKFVNTGTNNQIVYTVRGVGVFKQQIS